MKTIQKNSRLITFENASRNKNIPSRYYFQRWTNAALTNRKKASTIHIRIVNKTESAYLNATYRHKQGPTNILSFPFETPRGISCSLLGDLVICASVIQQEAREQKKSLLAHWAHITIHGTLHLLGYDHIKNQDALQMEALEIKLLEQLGYANPYDYVTA